MARWLHWKEFVMHLARSAKLKIGHYYYHYYYYYYYYFNYYFTTLHSFIPNETQNQKF